MKPIFKKSKETIVRQWLSKNRQLLGIDNSASACDMETIELNKSFFKFIWNGTSGTIECNTKVLTSTLIINQ